jgi:hypothetical protein
MARVPLGRPHTAGFLKSRAEPERGPLANWVSSYRYAKAQPYNSLVCREVLTSTRFRTDVSWQHRLHAGTIPNLHILSLVKDQKHNFGNQPRRDKPGNFVKLAK